MKRGYLLAFVFCLAVLVLSVLVSAQDIFGDLGRQIEANKEMLVLFSVFVIIFIFVFMALNRVPTFADNRGMLVLIAFAVSFLATYYLYSQGSLEDLLASYTGLGTLIIAGFPFLIWLFIVHVVDASPVRKVMWAVYLGFFIYTWYTRSVFGDVKIFWAVVIATLLMIGFDNQIHLFFRRLGERR